MFDLSVAKDSSRETVQVFRVFATVTFFSISVLILSLLAARFIFKIFFPDWLFVLCFYLGFGSYVSMKTRSELLFSLIMISDMVAVTVIIYYFMPFLINLLGSVALFVFICYLFFIGNILSLSLKKSFVYLFVIAACVGFFIILYIEYAGLYPSYKEYPIEDAFLYDRIHLLSSFSLVVVAFLFFYFHITNLSKILNSKAEQLLSLERELSLANNSLEEGVNKRTKQLAEIKVGLKAKVEERSNELKKKAEELEGLVGERAKELREKIEELEQVNRETINRELKMIGIKKEIKNIKK